MTDPATQPEHPATSGPPASAPASKQRSVSVGQILGGILLALIVIFIVENNDSVKIRLIAGPKVSAPISVALLIAAVVGALIAALLLYRRKRRKNRA